MIETTLRATSEKLWPGLVRIFGGPLISPAKRPGEELLDRGPALGGFEIALG